MPCAFRKNIPTPRPFIGSEETHTRMLVNCGKCNYCQSLIKKGWIFRFQQEARANDPATCNMITLTYKDSDFVVKKLSRRARPEIKRENEYTKQRAEKLLLYDDVQRRMQVAYKTQKRANPDFKGKHFYIGEYGTKTKRPHFHMLTFGHDPELIDRIWSTKFGHTDIKPASYRYYAYVVNYLDKDEYTSLKEANPLFTGNPQKRFMSPGIGLPFLDTLTQSQIHQVLTEGRLDCALEDGRTINIPRYFKEKILSEFSLEQEQRDALTAKVLTRATRDANNKQDEILFQLGLTPKYYQIHLMKEDERKKSKNNRKKRDPWAVSEAHN